MREKAILSRFLIVGSIVLLSLLLILIAVGCKQKTDEVGSEEQTKEFTFDLEEVSAFEVPERNYMNFSKGVSSWSKDEPFEQVERYPELRTDKPLYGELLLYGDLQNIVKTLYWVVDESAGPGKGYDTLYVDQNNDLDLGNDGPLYAQELPPKGAVLKEKNIKKQTCFLPFTLEFEYGDKGSQSVEIMPRLWISKDRARLNFVPTKVHKGSFTLAGKEFDVYLGYDAYVAIRGKLNDPLSSFFLVDEDDTGTPATWDGAGWLCAMHRIGGFWYQFSATARGDKVTATKYKGDYGTFELGAGSRGFKSLGIEGTLCSSDIFWLVFGDKINEAGAEGLTRSCRLPTGDYVLGFSRIQYGPLSIRISQNYHLEGQQSIKTRPKLAFDQWIYGITIRKDQPFVLDFSNEPEVLFVEPKLTQRFKPGEEVKVMAVLIDPVLDIMIRDVYDTRQKVTVEYTKRDGSKASSEDDLSLDPKVVVTRLDGTVVAEGVMPFG